MMFIKIKDKLKPLVVDRTARWLLLISGVLNLATWVLLLVRLSPLITSGQIVSLHYNIYTNVNAVGSAVWALAPAVIGSAILIINAALAAVSYGPSRQNALTIMIVTCFYELLTMAAGLFILLINIPH